MSAAPSASSAEIAVRPAKTVTPRPRRWTRVAYKAVLGWVVVIALACVRAIGPRLAMKMGRAAGLFGWWWRRADREIALANLALAFPEKSEEERRRIARESFARIGMCAFEWAACVRDDAYIAATVLEGREHVDAALAKKKGAMWVNAHIGNWELSAAATAKAGYSCGVIATTVRYPRVNRLSIDERARNGVITIERDSPSSGRELLKFFRKKESILGILLDHDNNTPSVQVDFFGSKAWAAMGVAELSLRLGAPVVSGFFVRDPDGKRRVPVAPPIFPPENVPKEDQLRVVRDLTQQYTKRIEDHIRAHPEDWAWMHRRWKP